MERNAIPHATRRGGGGGLGGQDWDWVRGRFRFISIHRAQQMDITGLIGDGWRRVGKGERGCNSTYLTFELPISNPVQY